MAHELEVSADGVAAAAFRSAPAWHGLGTVFESSVTTGEMLDLAHLSDWNVTLNAVSDHAPEDFRFVRQSYMVTRTNPFDQGTDVLATVGERYNVIQNEELFAFADHILDGGAEWESAGSLKDGRVVFGSLVIPHEFTLDPSGAADTTRTYLLVNTSHDGSVAVQASVTPVRVVCQNTLNIALGNVKQSFKVRHTQTVGGKVAAAREALDLTYAYMDEFEVEAQALYAAAITEAQFNALVVSLYPKPEKDAKGALTKWENKLDAINTLWVGATNENIRGTAWGALNTLTERLDYGRSGRGDERNLIAAASGFDPVTNAEKGRILRATKLLVGV